MATKVLSRLGESQTDDLEGELSRYKSALTSAAEETVGVNKAYTRRKKTTPWWTDRVREAVISKMKSFRKWMKTRTLEDRLAYIIARNEAERVKLAKKNRMWVETGKNLEEKEYKRTRKLL